MGKKSGVGYCLADTSWYRASLGKTKAISIRTAVIALFGKLLLVALMLMFVDTAHGSNQKSVRAYWQWQIV